MSNEFLKISTKRDVYNVAYSDIVFICSMGPYTHTYLVTGEKIISGRNLNFMCRLLQNHYYFFRLHKSYVVNLTKVKCYQSNGRNGLVVMTCGTVIPVSVRKKSRFLKEYKAF